VARRPRLIHALLLAAVCLGIYSNSFGHAYQLDDSYTIVTNPNLRSLRNIPRFFIDPSTYTSLRAQVDYRPVLQVSYALNYWMGGYRVWWWHLTSIFLHFCCVLGLYALCLRVLREAFPEEGIPRRTTVAFAAALVFAVHPTASGVVNYLNARSSLLTDALLFPCLVLYMAPIVADRYRRTPWLSVVCFTVALFTKVEAVAVLGALLAYEVWQRAKEEPQGASFFACVARALDRRTLRRGWPFLVVTAAYFAIRERLMAPFQFEIARHAADVGPHEYLATQTVAWWHYVANWFAPVKLIADDLAFPVYRSFLAPPVLLAVGGLAAVTALLLGLWRTRPYQAFLALSAVAIISPTSSVAPLAEMVNEHRPYMPIAVLSLVLLIPVVHLGYELTAGRRIARAVGYGIFIFVLASLANLTYQRNRVFASDRSYWADVVAKAPSSRAYVNYGLSFMEKGDLTTALDYFKKGLELAPYWHIAHINAAIAYRALGDDAEARKHFDLAVQYDEFTGSARTYRGEYELGKKQYRAAADDFEKSIPKSLEYYRNDRGLATAWAGLGDAAKSYEYTARCLHLDPVRTQIEITSIAAPFFEAPERARAGLAYFEMLKARLPDAWWVYANLATLADRVGDHALAASSRARSEALRKMPGSSEPRK
jgi:Tfp pilus assembly protein PilF